MKIEITESGHKGNWLVKIGAIEAGRIYYEARYGQHIFVPTDKIAMIRGHLDFIGTKLGELDWLRGVKHSQKMPARDSILRGAAEGR